MVTGGVGGQVGGVVLSGVGAVAAAGEIVTRAVNLLVQTVIVPGARTDEGTLIEAVALPWFDIIAFHCCPVKPGSPARNGMILNGVLSI
jgi:hypothetical protein